MYSYWDKKISPVSKKCSSTLIVKCKWDPVIKIHRFTVLNDKLHLPHCLIHHSFILMSWRCVTARQCLLSFAGFQLWFLPPPLAACFLLAAGSPGRWRLAVAVCSGSSLPFLLGTQTIPSDPPCVPKPHRSALLPSWCLTKFQHCIPITMRCSFLKPLFWRKVIPLGMIFSFLPCLSYWSMESLCMDGARLSY